jgi:hypothetical protein
MIMGAGMRRIRSLTAVLLLTTGLTAGLTAGLAAGPASAAAARPAAVHRVGSCRARGDGAACGVGGTARHPGAFFIHAATRPRQRVQVYWSMRCFRHGRHRRAHGGFVLRAPFRHRIRLPYASPAACNVSAQGADSRPGSLHFWVTSRSR